MTLLQRPAETAPTVVMRVETVTASAEGARHVAGEENFVFDDKDLHVECA
jgi:hypothetical protein